RAWRHPVAHPRQRQSPRAAHESGRRADRARAGRAGVALTHVAGSTGPRRRVRTSPQTKGRSAPMARAPRLAPRASTFDEVVGGLDASTALFEARRCLSCGNCFACDNCYGVCPDNAVLKLDGGGAYAYAIDLDYCKGCGLCAAECPAGAIAMEPEQI